MASDYNLVCRCCRSNSIGTNMVELAATAPHLETTFEEILARITGIDRKPHSGPSKICVKCSEVMIAADELRLITIESDKFFKNLSDDFKEVKQEVVEVVEEHLQVLELDPPILFEEVETEVEDDVTYENDSSGTDATEVNRSRKKINVKTSKSPNTVNHRLPSRSEFACCMCIKFCDSKKQLEDHLHSHTLPAGVVDDQHVKNSKTCWMCHKRFKDEKNLRLHQVRRYRPKTTIIYQCKHCGKIFQSLSAMRYCELKHEGKTVRYFCELCKASATSKTNLKTHMKLHSSERTFTCNDCGFAFKTASVLHRHKLTHTKVRNFSCEVCGTRFATSSSLTVHRRVHTGERPYSCQHPGCGKTFMHATDCQRHNMSHTGERPYPCSECEKRFRTRTLLKMHFRMHIGVKEFKCKLCTVEYFQPRSLKRHMAEKHSGVVR